MESNYFWLKPTAKISVRIPKRIMNKKISFASLSVVSVLMVAMMSGCSGDSPEPQPPVPPEPDGPPAEYTGKEFLRYRIMYKEYNGMPWPESQTLHIEDAEGNNLLDPKTPGNVHDNDFYIEYQDSAYHVGDETPLGWKFGYEEEPVIGSLSSRYIVNYLILGNELRSDKEVVFHWPEKNFKVYLRCVDNLEYNVKVPWNDEYQTDTAYSVQTHGIYVNGVGGIKCQLTVAADGTVSAKALRESDYKHAKRTDKKMK